MVDRVARNQLAERLRHLAVGLISNDRFENASRRSKDAAIAELEWRLAWPVYDDMREHRLIHEYALTYGQRRDFARAILFLKTDLEYEWETKRGFRGFLDSAFRLRPLRRIPPVHVKAGDLRVWPFFRRTDYFISLKRRPYLHGQTTSPP
jgi:hypothetical protein